MIQDTSVEITQVLIYSCKGESLEDIRVCVLFSDSSIGIFTRNPKKLRRVCFDEAKVERMWKNTASRSSGIICQYKIDSRKFVYLTNKFLRKPEFNNIKPYVVSYLLTLNRKFV